MEYANWKCQICGAGNKTLNVHHSYYTKGKEPWQYPDGSLICICQDCHSQIHPEKKAAPSPVYEEESHDTLTGTISRLMQGSENEVIWGKVLTAVREKHPFISVFAEAGMVESISGNEASIRFPEDKRLAAEFASNRQNKKLLEWLLFEILGRTVSLIILCGNSKVRELSKS